MIAKNFTNSFPSQKKSTGAKGKQFCIDCVEGAIGLSYLTNEGLRQSKENMIVNYNLANDILDERDLERVVNPWNFKGATFPAKMQNYPLVNPKIDLLIGEEAKRRFDYNVLAINSDAVSEKEELIKKNIVDSVIQSIFEENVDEREIEEKIKKLDKWSKYEAQDLRERRATQYLEYLFKEQELKIKFNQGFYDALISGEEIYCTDIVGGEPIVRKCDPLTITVIGIGTSHKVEDADIIIEDTYKPIGWVIDHFYDYLKPGEIDLLESGQSGKKPKDLLNYDYNRGTDNPFVITNSTLTDGSNELLNIENIDIRDYLNKNNTTAYDDEGNIRVVRVVWKSRRKIGELSFYDEDGTKQKKIIDENYKAYPELGEDVKWFWINEYWEAHRLADNIFVKYGPRPIQFRRMGNKSAGGSGYVGTLYAINSSKAMGLMDRAKSYQYLYNTFMYRTEMAFARAKGKIGFLDLSMIPDDWDMDKWIYYAEVMGWAIKDPFTEGQRGAATGKLAGNLTNQGSAYMDLELGSYIQQHISMLQFIENQLGQIIGITREREGQVSSQQTVGGTERSVLQSSHITEKWFLMHDDTKKRVLENLLETAKYAWRNRKNEKLQYISDEMSSVITELDGELFNEAEYGIMISNSSDITELTRSLRELAQAGLQNDKLNFSTLMSIYFSDSISSIRRKIEQSEEESTQRQQQQFQDQLKSQEKIAQQASTVEQYKVEAEDLRNIRDNETKILVESMKQDNQPPENLKDDTIDLEKVKQGWEKIDKDYKLKTRQLTETERHNKVQEKIAKIKPKVTSSK